MDKERIFDKAPPCGCACAADIAGCLRSLFDEVNAAWDKEPELLKDLGIRDETLGEVEEMLKGYKRSALVGHHLAALRREPMSLPRRARFKKIRAAVRDEVKHLMLYDTDVKKSIYQHERNLVMKAIDEYYLKISFSHGQLVFILF